MRQALSALITRLGLATMRVLARLPLSWLRVLGHAMGLLLYATVASRRHVVLTNLQWCFPHWSGSRQRRCARAHFVCFAQSWLDRGWLWHAPAQTLRGRVQLLGALGELAGTQPTVLFAPHFVGLDAAWTALTLALPRPLSTIYTNQANPLVDAWVLRGRTRFGSTRMCGRIYGVKPVVAGLKQGELLYLLPDMNFDPKESLFVPFYGVPAATVPSLPRFARLGRAKVVPVLARMTPTGYAIEVLEAWQNYPTDDLEADTAQMNARLQQYIDTMPAQYYWVHKRFKDRPGGGVAPY